MTGVQTCALPICKGLRPETTKEERWNRTDEGRFQAVYSCDKCFNVDGISVPEIEGVRGHARQVNKVSGMKGQTHRVRSLRHLKKALGGVGPRQGQSAYVITHGARFGDPDTASIVIGPCHLGSGGHFITARNLGATPELTGKSFLFFNSCSLGSQATPAASRGSYVGGFAEGLMRHAVCNETICHRWPVSQKWAKQLAEQFYRLRPLTAHARAAALLIARSKIEQEIAKETGEEQYDMTWLAPIHLWTLK